MSRTTHDEPGTMLELWGPPAGAGDAVGCLATTYTFSPDLFDERCLGRFLGIESEPERESLAFLLEREMRLGTTYAGVLVDATEAGVPHSLRWDVLPVRIRGGRQHAKVSLLAWTNHVRLVVASANLTEHGYRTNYEIAAPVDFTPDACDGRLLADAVAFLRSLTRFVPGGDDLPETRRALDFLRRVEAVTAGWRTAPRGGIVRHALACTLPGRGDAARGALDEFLAACRTRGTLPSELRVASPFFDDGPAPNRAAEAAGRQMARGSGRTVWLCVPGVPGGDRGTTLLHAPRAVYDTFVATGARVSVELVPRGEPGEPRPWHAKMIHAEADGYVALMAGSSNFTAAGLGLIPTRNAEANLVTIVDGVAHAREKGRLRSVWSSMLPVHAPDRAAWQTSADADEDEKPGLPVPPGFLAATFHAGDSRRIVLRLDPGELPDAWTVRAEGGLADGAPVLASDDWRRAGGRDVAEAPWAPTEPPALLRVEWHGQCALVPLNVADALTLPGPDDLREMTADAMLAIIASSDPGGAIRAWGRSRRPALSTDDDEDLDAATPIDLDPLSRYRLADTFLHRVRRRALVMAGLRRFVERPVASERALEWRLRGLVGIRPLAEKLAAEFESADTGRDPREALLTLADLLIVLREVRYRPAEGSLSAPRFAKRYAAFLAELAGDLDARARPRLAAVAPDVAGFWRGVVARCRT